MGAGSMTGCRSACLIGSDGFDFSGEIWVTAVLYWAVRALPRTQGAVNRMVSEIFTLHQGRLNGRKISGRLVRSIGTGTTTIPKPCRSAVTQEAGQPCILGGAVLGRQSEPDKIRSPARARRANGL